MFCHHHDEAEVYGTEPVPCPLCGLGAGDEPTLEPEPDADPFGFEDSNEALRNALFEQPGNESSDLTLHW